MKGREKGWTNLNILIREHRKGQKLAQGRHALGGNAGADFPSNRHHVNLLVRQPSLATIGMCSERQKAQPLTCYPLTTTWRGVIRKVIRVSAGLRQG